jgi:hypothetical protein
MTEHKPHLWLTEVIAFGEGSIDPDAGALSMLPPRHVDRGPARHPPPTRATRTVGANACAYDSYTPSSPYLAAG